LQSALAYFDCEITHIVPAHSHTIFVDAVRDLRLWQGEVVDALLYIDGQYEVLSSSEA
jgi:flavin reductase